MHIAYKGPFRILSSIILTPKKVRPTIRWLLLSPSWAWDSMGVHAAQNHVIGKSKDNLGTHIVSGTLTWTGASSRCVLPSLHNRALTLHCCIMGRILLRMTLWSRIDDTSKWSCPEIAKKPQKVKRELWAARNEPASCAMDYWSIDEGCRD